MTKIYSKKIIWSRNKTRKLIRMKKIGHRSYKYISKMIGCSPTSAKEKYCKIY